MTKTPTHNNDDQPDWLIKVLDALWSAQTEYKCMSDESRVTEIPMTWEGTGEFMYKCTQEALAAIPEENPMDKLLRWLNGYHAALERGLEQQVAGLPEFVGAAIRVRYVSEAFEHIYQYIEQEFGYSLPQEEGQDEVD